MNRAARDLHTTAVRAGYTTVLADLLVTVDHERRTVTLSPNPIKWVKREDAAR